MATAGCLGMFSDDVLVDETIDEGMIYEFDLESDTTLIIDVTYEGDEDDAEDAFIGVVLRDADQSIAFSDGTQEETAEFEYDVTESGSYSLQINPSDEFAVHASYEDE
ncbi:hypothetical protein OB905_02480 [Halobacteria archaeon AArc-dxtr1]|nr:hypothetical protein [Halobacteria archaeon AArc-dxtr1]